MDLSTISNKLDSGKYKTPWEVRSERVALTLGAVQECIAQSCYSVLPYLQYRNV